MARGRVRHQTRHRDQHGRGARADRGGRDGVQRLAVAGSVPKVEQAGEETIREQCSKAGRERILERFSSNHQAEGLARGLATLGVQVELTDLEMLPGLDPA